jgi:2-polyprenyl-3-methyl-5-hydroxy-6-metoxy-1,4-benzoquinol methylase
VYKHNQNQAGDSKVVWPFYGRALEAIDEIKNPRVINLGSGNTFLFENLVYGSVKNSTMTSVDIIPKGSISLSNNPNLKFLNLDICDPRLPELLSEKFDIVCIFEVLEHVDEVDVLLKNAHALMSVDSRLLISIPNLASVLSRFSLMAGNQPHILEASNQYPTVGMGILGDLNYKGGHSIHHIRGITHRAARELFAAHGFTVIMQRGYSFVPFWPKNWFVSLSQQLYFELKLS